jgi:hypothetical protein
MSVLSGKDNILERQIPSCCFLSIGPPFEGEAWSADGAEHGLHRGVFRSFVTEYISGRILHVPIPWNPFGRWAYREETCQCSGGAPLAINCDVQV